MLELTHKQNVSASATISRYRDIGFRNGFSPVSLSLSLFCTLYVVTPVSQLSPGSTEKAAGRASLVP